MNRRELFKGLFGAMAGIALAPLTKLFSDGSKTFKGRPIMNSIHASPGRIDALNMKHWYRAVDVTAPDGLPIRYLICEDYEWKGLDRHV